MRTYLVFEPADGGRNAETADRVRFLREKFSWPALFFTPLWLLWHRLWLAFVCWFAAVVLISIIAYALDLPSRATTIALWLPALIVASEAPELRRRKLLRRGFRDLGVALGEDLEDAERRFFAAWTEQPKEPRRQPHLDPRRGTPAAMPPVSPNHVIGLFPEPGGRR